LLISVSCGRVPRGGRWASSSQAPAGSHLSRWSRRSRRLPLQSKINRNIQHRFKNKYKKIVTSCKMKVLVQQVPYYWLN